ncbi:porin [Burkholderia sp. Ac-20379]|uniref:porin n=1 Tax=Burkholderia sp. Ac-20379 TaxID=2703900 RepID=UPI001981FA41|nr:porin [Burkholderia sp. Ac-20379]MBN3728916.1 porin [Burkholderia sp. Ac-20379]
MAIGIVAGAASLAASSAQAQSSVMLYGIVDGGVSYISNVASTTAAGSAGQPARTVGRSRVGFASGGDYGDRWGLKGQEDLGGGLAAIFQLENGFNLGNGALGSSGSLFNRQGFFGVQSDRYGSLTLGRQYEAITDLLESYGADFAGGIGTYPGDLSNYDNSIRINNSVKYRSPQWNGWNAELLYGFGNTAGSLNTNSSVSAGVNYVHGPVAAGVAYLRMDNSGAATNTWAGSADGNFGSSVTAGFTGARRVQIADAVANYTIGALTFGANYGYTQYQPSVASSFHRSVAFNSAGIGARYQASPQVTLGTSLTWTIGQAVADGAPRPRYETLAAVGFYNLSKRTGLYLYGGYQHAHGSTLDAYGNVVAATASLGDSANGLSSAGRNQTMVKIGLFNKF